MNLLRDIGGSVRHAVDDWNGGMSMTFKNECNCIVDTELLEKAVDTYCRRQNIYCHKEYRIVLHSHYPTIIINRKHLFVHDLLRAVLFHTRNNYIVHHKDFNKLNNSVDNLMYISRSKHTKIHSLHNWEKVRSGEKIIKRGGYTRTDISDDVIKQMLADEIPVKEIATFFNTGTSTIYHRMSKWKGKGDKD